MNLHRHCIVLDYGQAADPDLLGNLSGAAVAGGHLWTVSDEGRTVECLKPHEDGFRLQDRIDLGAAFPGLPAGEADLESVDVEGDHLWICGSHCRSRPKPTAAGLDWNLDACPSRQLLASFTLSQGGGGVEAGAHHAPFAGAGSLRDVLGSSRLLRPFLELPSKENGLDIEGLAVAGGRAFLGLRGPLLRDLAIIAEIEVSDTAHPVGTPTLHVLDLAALAVRDLTRLKEHVVILAGPSNALNGPFRIHRWRPEQTTRVQTAEVLFEFPPGTEHPEGLCPLERNGKSGLLVLYDSPDPTRIVGSRYSADWLELS